MSPLTFFQNIVSQKCKIFRTHTARVKDDIERPMTSSDYVALV